MNYFENKYVIPCISVIKIKNLSLTYTDQYMQSFSNI